MTTDYGQYYPPAPAPAPRRPWWRAAWVGLVAVGIVAFGVGAAAGGGSKAKTTTQPAATVTATATATATAVVTTTPTKVVATVVHTATVTYTPPVKVAFTDGTLLIPSEVAPGIYHTDGKSSSGVGCYYELRTSLDQSSVDNIITNDNLSEGAPTTMQIPGNAAVIKTTGGCQWTKIG